MKKNSIFIRQRSRWFCLLHLAAIVTIFISACGEGSHGGSPGKSSRTGSASVHIKWHDASNIDDDRMGVKATVLDCEQNKVEYVVCEVYDEDGNHLTTGGPWDCANGKGRIEYISAGANRTFVALAEDTDGNILYHGQINGVTISPNKHTKDVYIDAYPFIPTLSAPVEGAEVDPNGFEFSWQPVENADQYLVLVGKDIGFESKAIDDTSATTGYVPTILEPSTRYYWKILALDSFTNLGAESQTRSFTTSDCTYSISSEGNAFDPLGGQAEFAVGASTFDCDWVAVANHDWITITSEVTGHGEGYVTYRVAQTNLSTLRTGTIRVGGRVHTISQDGMECDYTISPAGDSFTFQGGTGNIQINSTADDCPWEAVSDRGWVTFVNNAGGSGDGAVQYQVAANPSAVQRSAVITIAGYPHTITQQGNSCTYQISPAANTFTSDAGTGAIQVTAQNGCGWSAVASDDWIVITAGSGSGNGTVAYRVTANPMATQRRGTITVGGQPHTITQSGSCNYAITPATFTASYEGDSGAIEVTTSDNCPWTAESDRPWIEIISDAGNSGSGTVTYNVGANDTAVQRRGTISVNGLVHTITQQASPVVECTYEITPAVSNILDPAGDSASISVVTQNSCQYSASTDDDWIHITSGANGTGPGTVQYTVDAQEVGSSTLRTGIILINNNPHTVRQAGYTGDEE